MLRSFQYKTIYPIYILYLQHNGDIEKYRKIKKNKPLHV